MLKTKLEGHVNNRAVYWIWDATSNKGKTWFATYAAVMMDAIVFSNGKSADLKYAYNEEHIVIFDFSRTQEDQVNYQAIEQIKNGRVFNTKYESCMNIFEPPHVVCFANFKPDMDAMSRDRWRVTDLDSPVLFVSYAS